MVSIMKNKLKYTPTLILSLITLVSGGALVSSGAIAITSSKDAVVTVVPVCTISPDTGYTYNLSVPGGGSTNTESVARNAVQVSCNANNGFSIQAVGYSPDATHAGGLEGNTSMYSTVGTIPTGTSGASYWAFKIGSVTSSGSSTSTTAAVSPYGNYASVPASAVDVVVYGAPSTPGQAVTGTFKPDYKVTVSGGQPAGSYTGQVKYTLVTTS